MTRSAGADGLQAGLKFSTHSLPRSPQIKLSLSCSSNTLGRNCRTTTISDPTLSPCAEKKFFNEDDSGICDPPPPKPSRVPSIIRLESKDSDGANEKQGDSNFIPHEGVQRVTSYHASGSDSGNGSGDSALSSAAGDGENNQRNCGVIIKNPRYNIVASESTTTLKNFEFDWAEAEEKLKKIIQPEINVSTRFDLENFHTLLLPVGENKPLDVQALRGIKMILQESGPRILANHLTKTDLDIIFHRESKADIECRLGGGIELCALPYGHQFRRDLSER